MCCENCIQVAHYGCVGLKSAPKGDWWCKECSAKKMTTTQKKQVSIKPTNGVSNVRMTTTTSGRKLSSTSSAL